MVEFDVVVMFPCEKERVLMKRRSSGEIDVGHGFLFHENSKVVSNDF